MNTCTNRVHTRPYSRGALSLSLSIALRKAHTTHLPANNFPILFFALVSHLIPILSVSFTLFLFSFPLCHCQSLTSIFVRFIDGWIIFSFNFIMFICVCTIESSHLPLIQFIGCLVTRLVDWWMVNTIQYNTMHVIFDK